MKLTDKLTEPAMKAIADKVLNHIPVNREDALFMLATGNILDLGAIASHIRETFHQKKTYYGVNMNLNYTNVCELRCPLCAFSCDQGDKKAFILSMDDVEERVTEAKKEGIDEIHIVGGLHPGLTIEYFETLLKTIRHIIPDVHIVAFTAVEYDYFATVNNLPLKDVFERLIHAGVNALPGGGAEIFNPEIRRIIAPNKISGDRWLEVMRTAHDMGLRTNATMLYNHRETNEDIVDHLFRLRSLQEETNGFKTFVPLQFHDENTAVQSKRKSSGYDDVRIYAASRIILHNIPHIKALWMYLGEKMAQVLQWFGVDDIGATYRNEKVVHAAGAKTPDFGSEAFLIRLVENAGFRPVRAAADYQERSSGTLYTMKGHLP
ncbi:MAG: CofH family radical SAM protein [Proteobacteria bacterium]|nr:CofH family radical SAM protein [Pseudomonadota bacterium]